jgi:hypothetical protein
VNFLKFGHLIKVQSQGITVPVFFFRRLKQIHMSDVLDIFFEEIGRGEKPITLDA